MACDNHLKLCIHSCINLSTMKTIKFTIYNLLITRNRMILYLKLSFYLSKLATVVGKQLL